MKKILLCSVLLMMGCAAQKKVIESQQIEVKVSQTPLPVYVMPSAKVPEKYSVVKGDCLWKIAVNKYADPFMWTSIWKSNRDKIQDPHWIYPKQVFVIERGQSDEKVKEARDVARKYHETKGMVKRSK